MANISLSFAAANQARIVADPATIDVFQTATVGTATNSAGDIIHFLNTRVPHGATILDVVLYGDTPDGTVIYQIGIGGGITSAALFGSATVSATPAVKIQTTGLPYRVSVSDDAASRFVYIRLTQDGAATSGTASVSLGVRVTYTMNRTNA